MRVVCDSTVLIGLAKVNKLHILPGIFSEIYIPKAVYNEVVIDGKGKPGSEEIANANWIRRKAVKDEISVQMLARYIDRGEAEVLILGKEIETDWLVIDDDKARDAAFAANFKVIGLVGLLVVAKQLKLIHQVKPILDELKSKMFHIGNEIYEQGLKEAGESFTSREKM